MAFDFAQCLSRGDADVTLQKFYFAKDDDVAHDST